MQSTKKYIQQVRFGKSPRFNLLDKFLDIDLLNYLQ